MRFCLLCPSLGPSHFNDCVVGLHERVAELNADLARVSAENKRLSDRQEHDFANNVRLMDQVAALRARLALADKLAASMRSAMRDCTDYPAVSEALFLYRASAGGES